MSRLMSLEDDSPIPNSTDLDIEETMLSEALQEQALIDVTVDQIAEAKGVEGVVDAFVTQLDSEAAVPGGTIAAMDVTLEHFRTRMGLNTRVWVATENFDTVDQRVVVYQLKGFQTDLKKSITVAQEGLGARIVNAFKRAMTNKKDILLKTQGVMQHLSHGAEVNGKVFEDAAWARIFAQLKKPSVTGRDVLALVKRYHGEDRGKMIPLVKEATALFQEISTAISGSTFIAQDRLVARLRSMSDRVRALRRQTLLVADGAMRYKSAMDVQPLDKQAAVALARAVVDAVGDRSLEVAFENFDDAANALTVAFMSAHEKRLAGTFSADLREFKHLCSDGLDDIWEELSSFSTAEFQVMYGAYRYLQYSVVVK